MTIRIPERSKKELVIVILLAAMSGPGCIMTRAGGQLDPIDLEPPVIKPNVEETVGDFAFTLEGGKMITSYRAGKTLNQLLTKHWKKQGYVSRVENVAASEFSGTADYNMTLSGSQYGESSIGMQLLSGLTLFLLPYSVDTKFDIQYTVEDLRAGAKYSAGVQDHYITTVQLFLLFALPFSQRGMNETMGNMADHLYQQLREKGAFDLPPTSTAVETMNPDSPPFDRGHPADRTEPAEVAD